MNLTGFPRTYRGPTLGWFLALAIACMLDCILIAAALPRNAAAQTPSPGGEPSAVILLARHGVRAPIESETRSGAYNAQPWPAWPVAPGVLTPHGAEALRLLGDYYRRRYPSLLGHLDCTHPGIYVEANTTQRTVASANAMLAGLAPECSVQVHVRDHPPNPLFSPVENAMVDREAVTAATLGRMGDEPAWFANAFARPLAHMRAALADCSGSRDCDSSKPDFRTVDIRDGKAEPRDPRTDNPVTLGADFAENFLLEYTEGLPMSEVGWGRVTRDDLNDLMEMNTRYHDFMLRTPLGARLAASDLAAHIRNTVLSLAGRESAPDRLGAPGDRFILLDGHDSNLTWLGGLLRLDWLLSDQTFNATPPGSALVFEIYGSPANSVRVLFISQTLDQMRMLRPLTGSEQPSVAPIFVPGCSSGAPGYPCAIDQFANVISVAIDKRLVEHTAR